MEYILQRTQTLCEHLPLLLLKSQIGMFLVGSYRRSRVNAPFKLRLVTAAGGTVLSRNNFSQIF